MWSDTQTDPNGCEAQEAVSTARCRAPQPVWALYRKFPQRLLSQMHDKSLIHLRREEATMRGLRGASGLTNPLSQVRRVHLQNGKTVRTRFRLQSHQWGTTVLEHGLSPQPTLVTPCKASETLYRLLALIREMESPREANRED